MCVRSTVDSSGGEESRGEQSVVVVVVACRFEIVNRLLVLPLFTSLPSASLIAPPDPTRPGPNSQQAASQPASQA